MNLNVRRRMLASMETAKFRISHLLTLMAVAAVSTALATINIQLLLILLSLWIGTTTAMLCHGAIKMIAWQTSITCLLVLDLCGACTISYGSWVIQSNPNAYPNSISLGDPVTAFLIGVIACTPIAGVLAIFSIGIAWLILNTLHNDRIDEQRVADEALDQPF